MIVRLFTTWYEEKLADRRSEYAWCLQQNLNSSFISKVFILDESRDTALLNDRTCVRPVESRPTFADFFAWINEVAGESDLSIIANTDIAIDDNLRVLNKFSWPEMTAMALSRWDALDNGTVRLFEHGDSQDCWLFRGRIEGVAGRFPLGVYDCDNKIAWELQQAGYRVINPSLGLRIHHHHQSGYRSYERRPRPIMAFGRHFCMWNRTIFGARSGHGASNANWVLITCRGK